MYHLVYYSTSYNSAAVTEINAVADTILTVQNNHIVPSQDMRIYWANAFGATIDRARFRSPYLNQLNPPWIRPLTLAALLPTNPNTALFFDRSLVVKGREELVVETVQTSGGAERESLLFAMGDNLVSAPPGQPIILRGTATTAAVAQTWTPITVTWEQSLPVGTYALIASEHFATNAIAHRWIFDLQYWRPGFPSFATVGLRQIDEFERYQMGVLGYFKNDAMPRIEIMDTSTDASHVVYLECIRVGS